MAIADGPPLRAYPVEMSSTKDEDKRALVHELYRDHRDAVARHLLATLGDTAVVEELVNETFIRAFQALDAFEARSSMATWLHGIARNVARNHLAKSTRRTRTDETQPRIPERTVPTPEDELAEQRAIRRFYAALERLEPGLREAFVARVIEQRPLRDVAERLGVAISTAHSRVERAEALVKQELNADEAP